jgi:hypothetical protein
LEHRRLAQEAAILAQGYTIERALFEYKIKYHTLPADYKSLQERIADPDGSLAAALKDLDPTAYHPTSEVAANSTESSRPRRGLAIRNASLTSTDDTPSGGLAYTIYELRLPGEDKITGTDDDWIVENGVVKKHSDSAKGGVGMSVSAGAREP